MIWTLVALAAALVFVFHIGYPAFGAAFAREGRLPFESRIGLESPDARARATR